MEVRAIAVNGRTYRWPSRPVVVVCLDGSAFDYVDRAIAAGVAPFLRSLAGLKYFRLVESALPSFTNPNNVSIVTGVPLSVHGISGNSLAWRPRRAGGYRGSVAAGSSGSFAVSHAAMPPAISLTFVKPRCCSRLAAIDDR